MYTIALRLCFSAIALQVSYTALVRAPLHAYNPSVSLMFHTPALGEKAYKAETLGTFVATVAPI
jgi:hypothetical protein